MALLQAAAEGAATVQMLTRWCKVVETGAASTAKGLKIAVVVAGRGCFDIAVAYVEQVLAAGKKAAATVQSAKAEDSESCSPDLDEWAEAAVLLSRTDSMSLKLDRDFVLSEVLVVVGLVPELPLAQAPLSPPMDHLQFSSPPV